MILGGVIAAPIAARLVGKLLDNGRVGLATNIGTDYLMLEARGVVRVEPAGSTGMAYLRVLKREIGQGGLSLQYSMRYLQTQVKDLGLPEWVNRLTPLVEFNFVTPVTDRYGEKTVGTINPAHLQTNLDILQKGPLSPQLYEEAKHRLAAAGSTPKSSGA